MNVLAQIFNRVKHGFSFDHKNYDGGSQPGNTMKKDGDSIQTASSWFLILAQDIDYHSDKWRINERAHRCCYDDDLVVAITRPSSGELCPAIRATLYRKVNSNGAVYSARINDVDIDGAYANDTLCQALILFNNRRVAQLEESARRQKDQEKLNMINDITRALSFK